MKKYIPTIIIVFAAICIAFLCCQPKQKDTTIADKIIAREIVDTSLTTHLNAELQSKIKEYNMLTATQKGNMAGLVMGEMKDCFGYLFTATTYREQPVEAQIIVEKASHYMLYGNASELMLRDSHIAQSLGENTEWKAFVTDFIHYDMDEYFSLIDEIMAQLSVDKHYHKEKIDCRQVIEDTYINCLDDEKLAEKLREYNKITAENHAILAENAVETMRHFFCIENEPYSHFDGNENVRKYATKVAEYSLYEERANMMYADEELGALLSLEMGGSAGVWPSFISFEGEAEYFSLMDEILK